MDNKIILKNFIDKIIKPSSNEAILIASSDAEDFALAQDIFNVAKSFTNKVTWIINPIHSTSEQCENAYRNALLSEPDIFFLLNLYREGIDIITFDEYRNKKRKYIWLPDQLQKEKKSRGAFFMGDNYDHFYKSINLDLEELKDNSIKIANILNEATEVIIEDVNGGHLSIDISDKNRKAKSDYDGNQHLPGTGVNFPPGEVLISPTVGGSHGTIYIDTEFFDEENRKTVICDEPIKIEFLNGFITKISGGKAAERFNEIINNNILNLEKEYEKGKITEEIYEVEKRNCKLLSEFAIGVNKNVSGAKGEFIGDLLYDEKLWGTCHIAFGSSYDGDNAPYHSDFIISKPKIWIIRNDKKILFIEDRNIFFENFE